MTSRTALFISSCGDAFFWSDRAVHVQEMFFNAIRDVAARNDRITQGNPVTVVAGEEKAGSFGFDVGHHVAVSAIANVVLRDGAGIECAVFKGRFAFDAEENPMNHCKL